LPEVRRRAKLASPPPQPPRSLEDGLTTLEVIAHRGTPRTHPENTLAGFHQAVELGADGIELDVHGTRDGVVVVHHDPVIPGRSEGVAGQAIADLAAGQLRNTTIPTLNQVLALVDGRARVYVEVKAPGIEPALAELLRPVAGWTRVHSFDHRIIARLARIVPEVRRGVLITSYLMDPVAPLRQTGSTDLWQQWQMIDEPLVQAVHAAGGRVIAWTVNDSAVADRLSGWGVDAICTDVCDALVRRRPR
jgi:glycerophosphoryl diester phosphodiesterase